MYPKEGCRNGAVVILLVLTEDKGAISFLWWGGGGLGGVGSTPTRFKLFLGNRWGTWKDDTSASVCASGDREQQRLLR